MNAPMQKSGNAIGTGVVTAAALAVACGICCALPVAVPAIALSTFGGAIAWFGREHAASTVLATLCVTAGWIWVIVQSRRAHRRPATTTYWLMVCATVLLVSAWLWPLAEPTVLRWLSQQ